MMLIFEQKWDTKFIVFHYKIFCRIQNFHKLDLDFIIFVTSRLTGVVALPSNLKNLDITGDFKGFCK